MGVVERERNAQLGELGPGLLAEVGARRGVWVQMVVASRGEGNLREKGTYSRGDKTIRLGEKTLVL